MHQNVTDLTPEQLQAIDLYHSGQTTCNIAKLLGIHRQTLWRWRQLPAFQEAYHTSQQQRREEMQERVNEIMRLSLLAIEKELKKTEEGWGKFDEALQVLRVVNAYPLLPSEPALILENGK